MVDDVDSSSVALWHHEVHPCGAVIRLLRGVHERVDLRAEMSGLKVLGPVGEPKFSLKRRFVGQ